jgi:xanthine dehydrogenase accessory factor
MAASDAEGTSVLVRGVGEIASAVARHLIFVGFSVALHQMEPPAVIRRRMAFADAWFDGQATLDGVEARRARRSRDRTGDIVVSTAVSTLARSFVTRLRRMPWMAVPIYPTETSSGYRSYDNRDRQPYKRRGGRGMVGGGRCGIARHCCRGRRGGHSRPSSPDCPRRRPCDRG